MAIYLRLGTPDQQGWIYLTGVQMPDGRFEVLLKPGVPVSAPMLDVLNDLLSTESEESPGEGHPIAGTG